MLPPTMRSCAMPVSSEYIRLGIMHILTGPDHMVISAGVGADFTAPAGPGIRGHRLHIGHSVTLALAVTGILRPHTPNTSTRWWALTIAVIGAEKHCRRDTSAWQPSALGIWLRCSPCGRQLLRALVRCRRCCCSVRAVSAQNYLMLSGHLRDAGRWRLVVTLVFGLIHALLRCHAASKNATAACQTRADPGRFNLRR